METYKLLHADEYRKIFPLIMFAIFTAPICKTSFLYLHISAKFGRLTERNTFHAWGYKPTVSFSGEHSSGKQQKLNDECFVTMKFITTFYPLINLLVKDSSRIPR